LRSRLPFPVLLLRSHVGSQDTKLFAMFEDGSASLVPAPGHQSYIEKIYYQKSLFPRARISQQAHHTFFWIAHRFELFWDLSCFSSFSRNLIFFTPLQRTAVNSNQPSRPYSLNMALPAFLVLSTFVLTANAAPLQPSQPTSPPTPILSNEAIVGLLSLFVAVFGITITLVVSPKMRRNLRSR
jgi:hypothetical protein